MPEPALTSYGAPLAAALSVLPCRDMERACAFYARLGLAPITHQPDYRLLAGRGVELHLRLAADAPAPGANPCGVYFRLEAVDALAAAFDRAELLHPPRAQPWGMYEFAVSDPDGALVRVGWPQRLRG